MFHPRESAPWTMPVCSQFVRDCQHFVFACNCSPTQIIRCAMSGAAGLFG